MPRIELNLNLDLRNQFFKLTRRSEKAGGDQLPPLTEGRLANYS